MLVIDDGSPDGTGEIADRLAAELPSGSTCSIGRRRRASDARTSPGFARVLESDAELVLEMDCDFSHDPSDVPG